MDMRKTRYSILLCGIIAAVLPSCMDDNDEPNTEGYSITSETSIGETNATIYSVKKKYSSLMTTSNLFEKVEDDVIFEGVICGNDEGGNLYQTLLVRSIDTTKSVTSDAYDQCITLGIKTTYMAPYLQMGQRIKVNLKGLYIGNYSKVPKIGQPYYTSKGNLRLGPMLLQMCSTNIELVGEPDLTAPEMTPIDLTDSEGLTWLTNNSNQTIYNTPMLVTVRGKISEVQSYKASVAEMGANSGEYEPLPKIFAPEELYDDGYGVDRTLILEDKANTEMTIRTSTQNDCSFLLLPTDTRSYTGMMTYYSGWQLNFRSVKDVERYEELLGGED